MTANTSPSVLSARTISLVKATVPVLQEHGEALTRLFYERMFRENPEVAPLFNRANQEAGTQQRALAAAVCAFAANVDRLELLGAAVETIAQKHASLRILPEHYPIVGENLLASIREVLGEAASDELIEAWAQAYGMLAEILIGREAQIYRQTAAAEGGWEGLRRFRIARKVRESDVITSFYLEPSDDGEVPDYKPGQYLTVRVPDGKGSTTLRNYSLSCAPGAGHLRISVKREPQGLVSNFLHSRIEQDELEIGPPCGDFFLDLGEHHERPLVLLSAGVGVTPMLSMLEAALRHQPSREVVFIHGALNKSTHAFGDHVRSLALENPKLRAHVRYSEMAAGGRETGRCDSVGLIDAGLIESLVRGRDADYYFCGPKPFMSFIYGQLLAWGIPAGQARFEFFGPKEDLLAPVSKPEPALAGKCPF